MKFGHIYSSGKENYDMWLTNVCYAAMRFNAKLYWYGIIHVDISVWLIGRQVKCVTAQFSTLSVTSFDWPLRIRIENPIAYKKKKEEGKDPDQVSYLIQNTIRESDKNTRKHNTQESQEVSPFPASYHKAAGTDKTT